MNKELFVALERGDVAKIRSLPKQVLLEVTFQRDTPLHIAAREGHQDIIEWILKEKPSLARMKNKDGDTPLHEAAKCGNPDVVRILLEHKKMSAYHYNKFKETPLLIALRYGHLESVKLLLEAKQYNDANEMRRCLKEVAYRGYLDIVKAIAGKPFKPLSATPLYSLLLLLDKYAGVANTNSIKCVLFSLCLHAAVRGGHLDIVREILNSPAWDNDLMTEKDECGRCPIHVAAIKGSLDIINLFLDKMPDSLEIRSSDHKSVLHFAVEYNQIQIVRNLLEKKSPQKVTELVSRDHDSFHNTAIHLAAKKGVDPELVEYLISFPGVDVNAVNDEDMTALDVASAAAEDKSKDIWFSSHNPNYATIEQKLDSAGGVRLSLMSKDIISSDPNNYSKQRFLLSNTKIDPEQGGDKDIVNTHMVVASLIATITFAAMFQIPGGIEDDKNSTHYGAAKMAFRTLFKIFMFSDTAAFSASFAVVIAWLVRQLFGNTNFQKTSVLSHMSVVTLLFSIIWTILAFVCATFLVILPPHLERMKIQDKEGFSKYKSLWEQELYLALVSLLYVGMPLLMSIFRIFRLPFNIELPKAFKYLIHPKAYKYLMYFVLCAVTLLIIVCGFSNKS